MFVRPLLVLALATGALVALPVSAQATARPTGTLGSARQDTFAHRLTVHGWAADPSRRGSSVVVKFYVDGRYAARTLANQPSAYANRRYHLTGRHNYTATFTVTRTAGRVTATTTGVNARAPRAIIGRLAVTHVRPTAGERIVAVARKYVGHARYAEGGTSPRTGFDCSGYTGYVYSQAQVHVLPRTAEGQRRARGMRLIPARSARPGDLVFYLSGGSTYHVAIYAGHHMQYAAATPRDGIRYQAVWSSAVQYGTDWH